MICGGAGLQPPGSIARRFEALVRRQAGIRRGGEGGGRGGGGPAPVITLGEDAEILPSCPEGMIWNGTECTEAANILPYCEEGMIWNGSECVCPPGNVWNPILTQCVPNDLESFPQICPEGMTFDGVDCVPNMPGPCPEGTTFDGVECIPNLPGPCPEGMKRKADGGCVTQCPGNRVWDSDTMSCVCFPGYIYSEDKKDCVPAEVGTCPVGQVWSEENKQCVEEGKEEDDEANEPARPGLHCDRGPEWYCYNKTRFDACRATHGRTNSFEEDAQCKELNDGWDRECETRGPDFWCKPGGFKQCVKRLGFNGPMANFSACKARLGRRCSKCNKIITNIYNINACPGHPPPPSS